MTEYGHEGCDHLALVYEEQREQLATVVPFVRQGLARGEKCLYVADDNTTEEVVSALNDGGVDVAKARRSGALTIRTKAGTYLEGGSFDRDRMLEFWTDCLDQARDRGGFDGLRAAAEMTWALDGEHDLDDLVEYESLLNSLYSGEQYTVLCQYNRDRFPSEVVSEVVRRHPLVVPEGRPAGGSDPAPPDDRELSRGSQAVAVGGEPDGLAGRGAAPASAPSTVLERAREPVRVLYVDDSPGYAEMAAELLERKDGVDTVVTETSPRDALARPDEAPVDCIVSDYDMPEMDGLELLDSVHETHPELPFILVTGKGDERVASEAISAGVTDYLQKRGGTEQYAVLANRISNAVEQRRTERSAGRTRRRYEKLVERSTDVIAVLDAGGRFEYLSPAAERRLGYPAEELIETSGLEYVHPEDRAVVEERFQKQVDRPAESVVAEFRFRQPDGSWTWLEAQWRNMLRDPDVGGVVMYARDITDRKQRERSLSESEQRFRSVFEKSFDAMVLADDDGRYVGANQAACELFELSREELIGCSIDEFVPQGYDFEAAWQEFTTSDAEQGTFPLVTAEGTERVVEFAATPNVVPGQHLSVMRDVTDRERYERALSELHHASRELLGAESEVEVARNVVGAATELLSMSAAAVYLFDSEEGRLEPTAVGETTVDAGALDPVPLDRENAIGSTFLDGECRRIGPDGETDRRFPSELPIHSGFVFSLGDHGVGVVGETTAAMTDEDRELTEILAAITETALDRVEKETELRAQKRELRQQNRRLERLVGVNATVRDIDAALVTADTRDEIEQAVCERLAAHADIAAAWICAPETEGQRLTPREWAGDGADQYLDAVPLDKDSVTPAAMAAESGDPVHVENIAEDVHGEAWRKPALSRGYRSVLSVPIAYRNVSYGILSVYAAGTDFFDELSRKGLDDLGTRVGNVMNAVEHRRAVLTESMTELELRLADERLPLNRVAAEADCSLDLETMAQQPDGDMVAFFGVEGADPAALADTAAELTAVAEASPVTDTDRERLVRITYAGNSLATELADRGVRLQRFVTDAGTATVTALVPEPVAVTWVLETFRKRGLRPELVAKTERTRSDGAPRRPDSETYREKLTPRQQEVLRTAYLSGFFRSPRECTGEELAEHLDVSPQTVYRHVRAAERKLFETVFSEG